jgi:hypothetical protein
MIGSRGTRAVIAGSIAFAVAVGAAAGAALSVTPARLTVFSKTVVRATCTLAAPAADASVREDLLNAGSNFGSATTLDVDAGLDARRYSFLRFDLAACALPAGAWVESATLTLTVLATPGARTYDVHRVTASWAESTVTWNNQPATAALPSASFTMPTSALVQREIDLTADVDSFVSGAAANQGWRLSDAGTTVLAALGQFGSREHATAARRPQLVVAYAY